MGLELARRVVQGKGRGQREWGPVLRVTVLKNTAAAVTAYFATGRGDYYAEGMEEAVGRWGGRAAERLGLEGLVEKERFETLCRNEDPRTGTSLTPRTNRERRVGFDLTFNCPKSVSVLFGLTEAPEIREAFQTAVDETMRELEAFAETRVRRDNLDSLRRTGNMLWSTFVHTTSRPVDGFPDMHLHCHAVALNLTWDAAEGRFKALDLGEVKRRASYFEAAFHSRLSSRLRSLGFDIAPTVNGRWEIAGIPQRILDAFSRRTELIERRAKELGITDAKEKDSLGARTRERKELSLTVEELRAKWWSVLSAEDKEAIRAVQAREVRLAPRELDAAHRAIQFAADHLFERQSVVVLETLLCHALRHGVGQVTLEELKAELSASSLIVREREGTVYVTSREVLEEERKMIAFARDGRGAHRPIVLRPWQFRDERLSDEQRSVVTHILESADRVMLIRGVAGSGKTTLMREVVHAIEAHGHRVVPLAPSAEASRGVLRNEGFASAETVARFLVDEELQATARNQVIWIDESGLLGSRTVAKLFALADTLEARVIMGGDERQHSSVERGSVFRLLQTEAGLLPSSVTVIRRQTGFYREAVEHLSRGDTIRGFDLLDQLGWVEEVEDDERGVKLARDYVAAIEEKKTVLVVSPTHAEGRAVTDVVRKALQEKGLIGRDEQRFRRLETRRLTEAERGQITAYRPGDVVEFHLNAPAFTKGSRYTVAKVGRSSLVVKDDRGRDRILPLGLAARFEVFSAFEIALAVGDKVRITRNGKSKSRSHRLDNGAVHTVSSFTPSGDIRLASGALVASNFAHFTYGYCVTSHAAQGKTVDRVLVAQSSESFPATSREQFYVSASRARERLTVYTDDKAGLRAAIRRADPRIAATDLLEHSAAHPAWRIWMKQRMRFVTRMVDQVRGSTRSHGMPAREVLP